MANYVTHLALKIRAQVGEHAVPPGDADALFRIYAVLALAKGKDVDARDVHNAWVAWMSTTDPAHDSAKPFEELDDETRGQDAPFVEAIHAALSD